MREIKFLGKTKDGDGWYGSNCAEGTSYMFDDTDIIQDSVWINPVDNRKIKVISVKGTHNTGNMLVDFIYVDNNDVGYAISKVFKLVFEKVN